MKIRVFGLLWLAAASLGTSSASVLTTVEVEDAFGGVSVINPYTWASGSEEVISGVDHSFLLPKFNPALGTLLSVQLRYTSSAVLDLHMTGSGAAFQAKGTLGIERYMLDANNNILFTEIAGVQTPGYPLYMPLGLGTFDAVGSVKGLLSPLSAIETSTITTGLAAYTGSGNFAVTYNSSQTFYGQTKLGTLLISGTASDGAAVSVAYTYDNSTATPEPATMSLIGGSLIGLAVYMRRKRRA